MPGALPSPFVHPSSLSRLRPISHRYGSFGSTSSATCNAGGHGSSLPPAFNTTSTRDDEVTPMKIPQLPVMSKSCLASWWPTRMSFSSPPFGCAPDKPTFVRAPTLKLPSFKCHVHACTEPIFSGYDSPDVPSSAASPLVSRLQGSMLLSELLVILELVVLVAPLVFVLVVVVSGADLAWPVIDSPQAVTATSVTAVKPVTTSLYFILRS
jgi:hypothetical protein